MSGRTRSFAIMVATAIAAAALFWLLRDHWQHTLGFLPYLLFLACPVMHLFMHHGHGHAGHAHNGHGAAPGPADRAVR